MNIVIAHGYAHRMLRNGMIESAPVVAVPSDRGPIYTIRPEWKPRSAVQMDLSGGDFEQIRLTLDLYRHIFFDDKPRLPHSKIGLQESQSASEPV